MTLFPVVVALCGSFIFVALFIKLVQRNRSFSTEADIAEPLNQEWSDEWFDEFSSFRYLPMRRLLSSEEEEYCIQSSGQAELDRAAFRADRRRLFRQYLRLIASDFSRLSKGVRLSVVHASTDKSAEIERLFKLEWAFRKLLWKANASLMFHYFGIQPVDATQLIDALQSFEFSLREIRIQAHSA